MGAATGGRIERHKWGWQRRSGHPTARRWATVIFLALFALMLPGHSSVPPAVMPRLPSAQPFLARASAWASAAVVAAALHAGVAPSQAAVPVGKMSVSGPELVRIVTEDFAKRRYLVTGELTQGVYADDAHFADSNNDFGNGLESWVRGVKLLFNSGRCKLALTGPVTFDEARRTITFEGWRQVDVFNLPGLPHTPVFTGRTVLTLDPVENIVVDHTETWDQTPAEIKSGLKFFDDKFDPPGFE